MNINSKIKAQPTYVYNNTLFKNVGIVSGVDIEEKPTVDAAESQFSISNLFSAECAVVRFYGSIPSQYAVYKEKLSWGRNGIIEGVIEDAVPLYPENEKINLDFHLKFLEAGEYDLYIEFYGVNSQVWNKKVTVSIVDDYRNVLEMYKVTPVDEDNFLFSENMYNTISLKGIAFQMSGNVSGNIYSEHSLFISQRPDYKDGIGLTHTLVIPLFGKLRINVHGGEYLMDEAGAQQLMIDGCVDYWMDILDRPIIDRNWIDSMNIPNPTPMLICIRKLFGSESDPIKIINPTDQDIYVDEYRFYPILHELTPFDNSQPITPYDIIYIKPSIRHSKPIGDFHWTFYNDTTRTSTVSSLTEVFDCKDGKVMGKKPRIFKGGMSSTIFAPQEPCIMGPGFYSIKLDYMEGDERQTYEINSAFLLAK